MCCDTSVSWRPLQALQGSWKASQQPGGLAIRRHPLLSKTTRCSCTHWNLFNWLVTRCFSSRLHRPPELTCFLTITSLTCWLLLPAAGACWAPGSCCFLLLLLLHGSYRSESLLITKGTHSQISAPPKIGAHSYIFSPPKIIKLWEKARYVWQYLKYDIQCIRWVEKMDYEFSHSRAPG